MCGGGGGLGGALKQGFTGGTVVGSMMDSSGADAAKSAAQAQMKFLGKGIDFNKDQLNQTVGGLQPYLTSGQNALGMYGNFMGLGGPEAQAKAFSNYMESPGQAFLREQGQKALLANSAAIGGLGGGNVRDALVKQGVGYASQDYNNYLSQLANMAGSGQNAATSLGSLREGFGGNIANMYGAQGAARSSGILGAQQAQAQQNQNTMGLLSTALPLMLSDVRLKSNIEKVGELPSGLGVYEYDIFDRRERGVLAQEVLQVIPEAVHVHESGYYMVDYSKVH